jgi:hypothetical protein
MRKRGRPKRAPNLTVMNMRVHPRVSDALSYMAQMTGITKVAICEACILHLIDGETSEVYKYVVKTRRKHGNRVFSSTESAETNEQIEKVQC